MWLCPKHPLFGVWDMLVFFTPTLHHETEWETNVNNKKLLHDKESRNYSDRTPGPRIRQYLDSEGRITSKRLSVGKYLYILNY